jgi:cyclophilin family peptidyl-prolyl cis-trans isomerase
MHWAGRMLGGCALLIAAVTGVQGGTLVQFRTVLGEVVVELYDQEKPLTTANFLKYIRAGRYTNMIAHRVVPNFVIQGGGFRVANRGTVSNSMESVTEFAYVSNEFDIGPRYRNLYGTLSMAKKGASSSALPTVRLTNAAVSFTQFAGLKTNVVTYTNAFPEVSTFEVYTERIVATNGTGATQVWIVSKEGVVYSGGPHSASSQWFLSFGDNSANLDNQNGGFTVFGEVVGTGMDVVDLVATLPTGDFSANLGFYGGNFTNTPYYVPEGGGPTALVVESISVVSVPEPTTIALALTGLIGLAAMRRRA